MPIVIIGIYYIKLINYESIPEILDCLGNVTYACPNEQEPLYQTPYNCVAGKISYPST